MTITRKKSRATTVGLVQHAAVFEYGGRLFLKMTKVGDAVSLDTGVVSTFNQQDTVTLVPGAFVEAE